MAAKSWADTHSADLTGLLRKAPFNGLAGLQANCLVALAPASRGPWAVEAHRSQRDNRIAEQFWRGCDRR